MKATKAMLVVCDGLGDRPIAELNNLTPLESAKTPNLDLFADRGISGLVRPFDVGTAPGSDTAHFALLGYAPNKYYTGRGPLEAAGTGINMKLGDLCFRVNFATCDRSGKLVDRRAGRIASAAVFEASLNTIKLPGVEVIFRAGSSHRGALVLRPQRGTALSDAITSNDPHASGAKLQEMRPRDNSLEAKTSAELANDFVNKARFVLGKHAENKKRLREKLLPANALLLRGVGFPPSLDSFENKHGLSGACVAGGAMYKGVAKLAGFEIISVKGATARPDTDLHAKVGAARRALERKDFVFLHIKATDTYAHDGDFMGKKMFIERIDEALGGLAALENALVVVTGDHTTSCELKAHTGDPVPIVFSGSGVRRDSLRKFGERDCARGGLGTIHSLDVMPEILNLLGRPKTYGA